MLAPAMILAAAACSPPGGNVDTITPQGTISPAAEPSDDRPPLPDRFDGTAWRAVGVDGARYTTLLDSEGRYRDLRNGEPWHQGTWTRRDAGAICFLPDGDDTERRCWTPDRMSDEDQMVVIGGEEGARVELSRADYSAPAPVPASTEEP